VTWTLTRDGGTLHVTIAPPIHDWNPLLQRLVEEVDQVGGVTSITLPTDIPFTDARDKETLQALWTICLQHGISVQRDRPY
jgi:hypothetical protein